MFLAERDYIMVATGYGGADGDYLDHVEIINMKTLESCSVLPEKYPYTFYGCTTMMINNEINICSGYYHDDYKDCYGYDGYNDRWNIKPYTVTPGRYSSMAVEIRPGEWFHMGGYGNGHFYADTHVFSSHNRIFVPGPYMPNGFSDGSAVMLNETHLFIAGGHSGSYYLKSNYLLEIRDPNDGFGGFGAYTYTAARKVEQGFPGHMSGTFLNSTAGEIQVANIGSEAIQTYSPRDDTWTVNNDLFPAGMDSLSYGHTVQEGADSFLIFGGVYNGNYSADIFRFDESGLNLLKAKALQVERDRLIAIPIPSDQVTCY